MLGECVTKLQNRDDEQLWLRICQAVNKLFGTNSLQINTSSTPSNSKLNIQPLCCTIEHLLLHPIKTADVKYVNEDYIKVWKQLLTNTGKLLRYFNSPPIHYPDSETSMKLPIAHVDNLLSELAPHLKYAIALSDSNNTPLNETIATYLGCIIDELSIEFKSMIDNRGSVPELVFSSVYELWLLLIERNTSIDTILQHCRKVSGWSGFSRFLQKVVLLPHSDQFTELWRSHIDKSEYQFDDLEAGFQSTSPSIKELTIEWYRKCVLKWTIPPEEQQKLHVLAPSLVENIQEKLPIEQAPKSKQTRFKTIENSDPTSPRTPTETKNDSLLSIDDSPLVEPHVAPLLNSPVLLKSASKRKFGDKKKPLEDPPNRPSTVKKRKLSKSQFVVVEGDGQEDDTVHDVDLEKRKEQRRLFREFNPTLPSLDPSIPQGVINNPTNGRTEVESLFSDLNTGCTPAKSVPPDSPVACLTVMQPKRLFENDQETQTGKDKTEERLSQAVVEIEVNDVLKMIRSAKSRLEILENASKETKIALLANVVKIQKEAMMISLNCNQYLEMLGSTKEES